MEFQIGSIVKFTGPYVGSPTYQGPVVEVYENGGCRFFDADYGTVSVSPDDMTDHDCSFRVVSL